MSSPLISILICFRNRASFLEETVRSLMRDPFASRAEIIFVDDGSTDGGHLRIPDLPSGKLFRLADPKGVAHGLNVALKEARGEYLTFFDSDDLLAPDGIAWRVRYLQTHEGELGVGGKIEAFIDAYGRPLDPQPKDPPFCGGRLTQESICARIWFPCGMPFYMFRRSLMEALGPFDESLRFAFDQDFLFRALKVTSIPVLGNSVLIYRVHDQNLSLEREGGRVKLRPEVRAESYLVHEAHRLSLGEPESPAVIVRQCADGLSL